MEFDAYLNTSLGGDDAQIAKRDKWRDDGFELDGLVEQRHRKRSGSVGVGARSDDSSDSDSDSESESDIESDGDEDESTGAGDAGEDGKGKKSAEDVNDELLKLLKRTLKAMEKAKCKA